MVRVGTFESLLFLTLPVCMDPSRNLSGLASYIVHWFTRLPLSLMIRLSPGFRSPLTIPV